MNTIFDYISWRGDLRFSGDPFNDVDNYLIAKLGTPDFSGIVPEDFRELSLKEALSSYEKLYGEAGESLGALTSDLILPAMRLLPGTERFAELSLSGFRNRVVAEETEQFSAMTVRLPDGRFYISFRGTDDTLLGWKENLMMSVEPEIAAQKDAASYLSEAAAALPGRLLVGGHSKGGNLAIYAAATVPPEVQERIDLVYSNDGPGFRREFLLTDGYRRIRPKLRLLIPEHSVIGTLLFQDAETVYIRSRRTGIPSHDGFHWQVMGPSFVRAEGLSGRSRAFHDTMLRLTEVLSPGELRSLIDEFFRILSSTGASTVTDLTELKLKDSLSLANSLRKAPESRRLLSALFEALTRGGDPG